MCASRDQAVTDVIEGMREKRLWMVKTDIEYATLFAALLLRLKNPDAADFALSWPLKDGGRRLHACTPARLHVHRGRQ